MSNDSALMTTWTRVYEDFDPSAPAEKRQHVARDRYNPVTSEVCVQLRLPLSHQKFILAGGIGSGKSTELRAVLNDLHHDKDVLFLDLVEHYQQTVRDPYALERIEAVELIGLIGLAILRFGREVLKVQWGEHEARFSAALTALARQGKPEEGPTLDIAKLTSAVGLIVGMASSRPELGLVTASAASQGVQALKAAAEAWTWRVGLFGRPARGDQEPSVLALASTTNALLDHLSKIRGRPLVLVVDGLDRVRAEEVFSPLLINSSLLAELRADLVITADLGLVERHRAELRAWDTRDFTYVPVAQREDPKKRDPRGVDFLAQVAEHRLTNLGQPGLISRALLQDLGYYSAGSVRDFVTLVRNVAVQAMIARAPTATDALIDKVLDRHRREQEAGLNRAHVTCLQQVLNDPDRIFPEDELAGELVKRQLLLAYPNESTWYLPHTALIWKMLTRAGSST